MGSIDGVAVPGYTAQNQIVHVVGLSITMQNEFMISFDDCTWLPIEG